MKTSGPFALSLARFTLSLTLIVTDRIVPKVKAGLFSKKVAEYPEPHMFEEATKLEDVKGETHHDHGRHRASFDSTEVLSEEWEPELCVHGTQHVGPTLSNSGEIKFHTIEQALEEAVVVGHRLGPSGVAFISNQHGYIQFYGKLKQFTGNGQMPKGGLFHKDPDVWRQLGLCVCQMFGVNCNPGLDQILIISLILTLTLI